MHQSKPFDLSDTPVVFASTIVLYLTPVSLKFIQLFSAGVDRFAKHPIYTDSDIPFTTVSGIHGPPISEWVLGTCLTFSKHLYIMHDWQREHQYGGPSGPAGRRALGGTTDWVGKRIGIAGYGSIGRQIARVFVAMGSEVVAYTASPRSTPESRRDKGYIVPGTGDAEGQYPTAWFSGTSKESLSTFLRSGLDALVISLPLTPSTEHLFGKAEFEVIKSAHPKGTFLINISRGKIVNQPDLIAALNDDTLKGAALDVTTPEPLPKDDPLWDAKNCIVTPHISALGTEYMTRAYDVLMTNLERLGKGEGLVNEVNRRRGY